MHRVLIGPPALCMPTLANKTVRRLRVARKGIFPLAIEQPTKLELIINMKTAKSRGLRIPPSVLALADKVIRH